MVGSVLHRLLGTGHWACIVSASGVKGLNEVTRLGQMLGAFALARGNSQIYTP